MAVKKDELKRIIKFTFFSLSAGMIQIGSFTLLFELLHLKEWISYLIALVLSVVWNFTLNRKFTFASAANVPKGKMKNAVLIAAEYIGMLPAAETPATTAGYEGFYHVADIAGNETETRIFMIIRDHDRDKFESRKARVKQIAEYLNSVYGIGTVEAKVVDSYYNMKEKILPHMYIVENAEKAMKRCGVQPEIIAIRGGTDGARLSYMGLPCPNLSTGGVNFHSVRELIPVESLEKMVEVLVALASMEK